MASKSKPRGERSPKTEGLEKLAPLAYPKRPNEPKPFVAQLHARGRSVHLDLRFSRSDVLEGWTVMVQQPGAIREPILDLPALKRAFKDKKAWKIDWSTGEILPRRVRTTIRGKPRTIVRRGNLRAAGKAAEIPKDWLRVEGVTRKPEPGEPPPVGGTRNYPGVFLIVDEGTWTPGARKPYFYEYFIQGKRFRGRYAFRLVSRKRKASAEEPDEQELDEPILPEGKPEERAREGFYWVFMGPLEERWPAYVLSPEAVEKGWLPPYGVSALPPELQKKIPKEYRYWEIKDRKRAREVRDELVKNFEEIGGPKIEKESGAQGSAEEEPRRELEFELDSEFEFEFEPEPGSELRSESELKSSLEKIRDLEGYDPRKPRNDQLADDARIVAAWWARLRAGKPFRYTKEEVLDLASKIFREIARRKREGRMRWTIHPERLKPAAKDLYERLDLTPEERRVLEAELEPQEKRAGAEVEPVLERATPGEFKLYRHQWKGQHVIRWGPSTIHWDLLIRAGDKFFYLVLDRDPSRAKATAGFSEQPEPRERLWRLADRIGERVELEPGTPLNPTKETSSWIELVDRGTVKLIDEGPGWKKFQLEGKKLRGAWFFRQEEEDSPFWIVQPSEGPKVKAASWKAAFVYQLHEWAPRKGDDEIEFSRHFDLRILPEGEDLLLEFTSPKDLRELERGESLLVERKSCGDLSWMKIDEPNTPKFVEGQRTWVTPLDQGEAQLLVEGRSLELVLAGRTLKGRFRIEPSWDGAGAGAGASAGTTAESEPKADASSGESLPLWKLTLVEEEGAEMEKQDRKVKVTKEHYIPIAKIDQEERVVYGIVLQPDVPDAHGDVISKEEIRKTAHDYMIRSRVIGFQHRERIPKAYPVESILVPFDSVWWGEPVRAGTWILGTKILDDEIWEAVKKGELTGYSIGGRGIAEPLDHEPESEADSDQERAE